MKIGDRVRLRGQTDIWRVARIKGKLTKVIKWRNPDFWFWFRTKDLMVLKKQDSVAK